MLMVREEEEKGVQSGGGGGGERRERRTAQRAVGALLLYALPAPLQLQYWLDSKFQSPYFK